MLLNMYIVSVARERFIESFAEEFAHAVPILEVGWIKVLHVRQVASSSDQRAAANAAGLSSVAHSGGSGVRGLDGGAMAKALTEIALAPAFVTEIVMMIFPRGSHALGISLRDVSEVSAATKERKRGRQGRRSFCI